MRKRKTVPGVEGMEVRTVLSAGTLAAQAHALAVHPARIHALSSHAPLTAPAPHHAPAAAPVYILPPWIHLARWTPVAGD